MLRLVEDVTVVIPTIAPRAKRLNVALESIDMQDVKVANVIISEDTTHAGAAPTRNNGLNAVTTEWVAFLDDDDYFYPQHIANLLQHARATEADLVYPWFDVIGGTDPLAVPVNGQLRSPLGVEFGPEQQNHLMTVGNFIPVTTLVKTELAQSVGGFPDVNSEEWPNPECEDWGFLQRLIKKGAKFSHLPERTWAWVHWNDGTHGNTSGLGSRW